MDIKDFLFRHVEKFIFGTLVLLAVFLIYRGFQMPDYLSEQQPDRMEQAAKEVKTAIDVDHWEDIAEPRLATLDVVARANASMSPVNPQVYQLREWELRSIDMGVKREDPAIPAPIELLVSGVISGIAYKTADPDYPLMKLENADPIEKAPEPKPKSRRRKPQLDPYGYGDMGGEMGGEMYGAPIETDYGPMGMDGAAGAAGATAVTPARKVDPKYDQGFRPEGSAAEVAPAMGHFIAGVALMPHKQLHSAFEEALQQADGYQARRDRPRYIGFMVQRADVTEKAVDQLEEQDWVRRLTSAHLETLLIQRWAGMAKEIVAGKYRDPKITTPIPPVLLTHYSYFSSHPKIPLGDEDPQALQRQARPQQPIGPITFDEDDDPFASQGRMNQRRGSPMDAAGGDYDYGMDAGGYGMPTGMYGSMSAVEEPDHKLIRFYDFRDFSGTDRSAPQPGRRYVYRIRIGIEDPNFPENPALQPRNSTLSVDAFRRVQQEIAKATQSKRRNYIRWSDWSAPSPAISLPPTTQAFAGPVTPPQIRSMQVQGRKVEFVQKPATGKLVVAQWETTYQAPVPVFMDVLRGSLVAKKGVFDVPDPLSMTVKKLPETTVNTQTVVLDIGGGNPLTIIPEADNQTEPGVMLLFDADGGLRVADEVESQQRYRMYSFADDRGE